MELNMNQDTLTSPSVTYSAFQIGSISELCSKLSAAEQVFPKYTYLLFEENASDSVHSHTFPGQRYKKHTNEKKQSHNLETNLREKPNRTQKVMGKPKLIELYQFSKLDESQESELANGVSILQILRHVTQAQPALRKESKYKPYFEKVFYSPISHSILKDVFWWMFLDGWNPDKSLQEKLFERVAYNYVQLIILANHPYYAEPFLKSYPHLLSQSTYAAFCEAFSDSYSNFNNDFKEKLVNLVYQWVTGLKPAARSWLKWNLDDLEPVEIRNRRDLLKTSSLSPQKKSTDVNEFEMNAAAADEFHSVSFDLSSKDQRKSAIPSHVALKKINKESHPSGKGPDFVQRAFLLNGKSPLVMHYLAKMNLQVDSGMEMVVQRTELENLPPYPF